MIGFFGCSWIDIHGHHNDPYWPVLVSQLCDLEPRYMGASGSSHYNAFQKFLKNYKKFKVIVFSHTAYTRYPCLPEYEEKKHLHWNTTHHNIIETDFFKAIAPYYDDLFPDHFLTFLCGSIYKEVNRICRENNIYLINIIPYDVRYDLKTNFPVIENLYQVSKKEIIKIQGKEFNADKWISSDWGTRDFRMCHFNFKNHKLIANLLYSVIQEKVYNKTFNLLNYPYELYDEQTDLLLSRMLVNKQ
jgi:hypothetical protein